METNQAFQDLKKAFTGRKIVQVQLCPLQLELQLELSFATCPLGIDLTKRVARGQVAMDTLHCIGLFFY